MKKFLLALLLVAVLFSTTWGATYYVCASGNASAPTDGTCTNAYAEVEDAIQAQTGTNTFILLSDIAESDTCQLVDANDGATIDLNGYTWSSDGSFNLILSTNADAENITIRNGTLALGTTEAAKSIVLNNNTGYNNWIFQDVVFDISTGDHASVINLALSATDAQTGWIFKNCLFLDDGDDYGVTLTGETGITVFRDCVFTGFAVGILYDDDGEGDEATAINFYNTVLINGGYGVVISNGTLGSKITVQNCILGNNSNAAISDAGDGADPVFVTNSWYLNDTDCGNCTGDATITTNPLLLNYLSTNFRDFRLKKDSPCIDAGTIIYPAEDDCADDDTADWTFLGGGGSLAFDTDHYEITGDGGGPSDLYVTGTIFADNIYEISVDIKDGTATSQPVTLHIYDGAAWPVSPIAYTTTGSWQTITQMATAVTTTSAGHFHVYWGGISSDNIEIKNFRVFEYATDAGGRRRVSGSGIDIGAFEGKREAIPPGVLAGFPIDGWLP